MTLLAFDTACDACSVALWREGEVLAHRTRAMSRGQSEALVPMIADVMAVAGLTFEGLSAIAVTIGPGAFTGLRIALATARALALAAQRPAVGVSTLETIAAGAARAHPAGPRHLLVAIDTKRDDFYGQRFTRAADGGFIADAGPIVGQADELAAGLAAGPILIAGDGAARLMAVLCDGPRQFAASGVVVPDAVDLAIVAASRLRGAAPLPPLKPLYLRPPAVRPPHPVAAGAIA